MKKILSFLRWRLVPIRYLTMVLNLNYWHRPYKRCKTLRSTQQLEETGVISGPTFSKELVNPVVDKYAIRANTLSSSDFKAPFVNLFKATDIEVGDPVVDIAMSKDIWDMAIDYFSGDFTLNSVQLLYSFALKGDLKESQLWHLDYGDKQSLHALIYINDVLEEKDGPFTFLDKQSSKTIKKSILVRRLTDEQINLEKPITAEVQYFYGDAGTTTFVDPACCYHYGSRCQVPRLAMFVTFNTLTPFAEQVPIVGKNKSVWNSIIKEYHPEFSDCFIKKVLAL